MPKTVPHVVWKMTVLYWNLWLWGSMWCFNRQAPILLASSGAQWFEDVFLVALWPGPDKNLEIKVSEMERKVRCLQWWADWWDKASRDQMGEGSPFPSWSVTLIMFWGYQNKWVWDWEDSLIIFDCATTFQEMRTLLLGWRLKWADHRETDASYWPVVVVGVLFGWIGHCTHLLPLRIILLSDFSRSWGGWQETSRNFQHNYCLIRSTTIPFPMAGHNRLERQKLISPSGCCRVCAEIGILTPPQVINQLMICFTEGNGW